MENKITKIQVLGTGCPTCKQLFEAVKKIATELKIETEVEHVTDISEMVKMGVMTSPVLVVNDKPTLIGRGHSDEEIRNALKNNPPKEKGCGGRCSCCCDC